MKQFQVMQETAHKYGIDRNLEIIEADYMKLEGGHLIFSKDNRGGYPDTIRVFAPGAWTECKFLGYVEARR